MGDNNVHSHDYALDQQGLCSLQIQRKGLVSEKVILHNRHVPIEAFASSAGGGTATISATAILIFLGLGRGDKAESESSSRCELHGLLFVEEVLCALGQLLLWYDRQSIGIMAGRCARRRSFFASFRVLRSDTSVFRSRDFPLRSARSACSAQLLNLSTALDGKKMLTTTCT